jgi:branched-chain amino acid transport system substrate-binding protein
MSVRFAAAAVAFSLIGAACGDDNESSTGDTTADTTATSDTTATADTATADTTSPATDGCPAEPDTALDETNGIGAGAVERIFACAEATPLKAEGEPIVIGLMNPEGDPAGSFPEVTVASEAAVDYINNELGGVGADFATGTPGRPIKLEVCKMTINPADSQKCANELAAKNPIAVMHSINFFGNHLDILNKAGIPSIIATAVTAADFTAENTFSIGGGGGCLGAHTGLVQFVTQNLGRSKIAVPWANTPPGVFCYNDLEKKPLDVLNGTVTKTTSKLAGSMPDLTHIGVPIKPGQADVTPDAQKVLDFEPDGIIFSAQGADCWTLVNSMLKLGWTPDKVDLVLSGSCLDLDTMGKLGDKIAGIHILGGVSILTPDALEGQLKREALIYAAAMDKYAKDTTSKGKGYGTQGFSTTMTTWQYLNAIGPDATSAQFSDALTSTSGNHGFASTGISCGDAPEPYIAVCNSEVTVNKWNGTGLEPVAVDLSGVDLVAGTDLDFGN